MKAVILAGGRGERLGKLTEKTPKPMIEVGGKPLLEHQIRLLTRYGFKDIILCTGHVSGRIEDHFGDGRGFKARIEYSIEDKPLGSAGCLRLIEGKIKGYFILLNGDVMVDMNLKKLVEFHKAKKANATLTIHPNNHPNDSDLLEMDSRCRITAFHRKPMQNGRFYTNLVNAGVHVLSERVLRHIPRRGKSDLYREVFPRMIKAKERVFGYNTPEYIKDMGTPERLRQVRRDYTRGLPRKYNLEKKRPAFFLDRDGVINVERHLLNEAINFELIPGSVEAIRRINESGHLAIVVTNQPVVARGLCTFKDVEEVHKKMETLLGKEGAKLDAIYWCPHHPDRGYNGENRRYKTDCECRKPKTGMIREAARRFNIDLKKSYIIGDSTRDIKLGKNAGIKTVGVKTGHACRDGKYDVKPDYTFKNLHEAVKHLLKNEYI
ncbi:MAG: HAD-IIIA family hydrolase [Candidatus Altiarchaeota archaeon]